MAATHTLIECARAPSLAVRGDITYATVGLGELALAALFLGCIVPSPPGVPAEARLQPGSARAGAMV
jgi:hypothetical protein